MSHFVVSAVGADRPGIVAAVTGAFAALGCNLEDTSMSILQGHFAMMLMVSAPPGCSAAAVEAALAGPAQRFDLVLAVRAIADTVPTSPAGDRFTVSVYGADRPGIVHRITADLADASVNVCDLTTRVIGGRDRPVYAMVLDVTVPDGVSAVEVDRRLHVLASELGVECSMHAADADIL